MNSTDTALTPAFQETVLSSVNVLLAMRYLGASAITLVLWEHLLTLRLEIFHIWGRKMDITKIVFLFNRYTVEGGLLLTVYAQAGFRPQLDQKFCTHFMIAIWLFVLSTVTSSNIYMMCYYYSIWDQRKSILYLLIGVLSVTYLPGIALGLFSTRAYANDVVYVPALDQCILASQTAPTKAFWGCLLAFDVVAIIIGLVNSLDRPYKHRTDVVQSLQRDGAAWFVGIALLRVINFVLGIVMPSTEVLLLAFNAWALINVTLTRLVLRVEELKNPSVESVRVWNLESDMFELRQYSSAPKTSDAR